MSSSDRLAELRRQRALLQEHLAWLDREIATAEKAAPPPPAAGATASPLGTAATDKSVTPAAISTTEPSRAPVVAETVTAWTGKATKAVANVGAPPDADADAIIEKYRVPTTDLQSDIRKGCLLYFVAAFLILGAVVTILYVAFRH